jgi:TonB family protein
MSYKSLLFCPDEKTARVVTQVLSELEFTVELSGEPFATVKKLTDEHFDALVVDCQNEQDASLIFKAARNSNLNHSSLSVAVVEGQAGVAKAFRIGANLVLSKPVNVEQSKSTLRVARGLLRKNSEARAASSLETSAPAVKPASAPLISPSMSPSASPAMLPSRPFAYEPAASPDTTSGTMRSVPTAPTPPPAPYSALELEKEPTPAAEPGDAALLESMPDPMRSKPAPVAEPMWAPRSQGQGQAQPIAASTTGNGAAAAPALIRPTEVRLTGLSPMVTNEPIVADSDATEHFPVTSIPVPTFATLDSRRSVSSSGSSGGKSRGKSIVALVILGVAGYLAWQNIQPLQYLPGSPTLQRVGKPAAAPAASPAPASSAPASAAPSPSSAADTDNGSPDVTSSDATPTVSDSATVTSSSPVATAVATPSVPARTAPDNIRVQEMPMNSDQKTRLASKAQPNGTQPIVVKTGTAQTKPGSQAAKPQQSQPTPPTLTLSASNNPNAALASIVSTSAAKPTLGSVRVSQGVSQGLVVKKVAPVYSATALQLHKEGTVELMATISKDGAVTSVQVLKGDLLLAKSAVDAVKQWKYRPYLLNGEPVEIQTQIVVNFKMPQ